MRWSVVDGPKHLGAERYARYLALGDRGRAGESLSEEEMAEYKRLSDELSAKVFAEMERPYGEGPC